MQARLTYNAASTYLCEEDNLQKVDVATEQAQQTTAYRIGDETAFEKLFRQFHPSLCRYAFTIVKDIDGAEEIVQDVFVRIWEKRDQIEFTVSAKSYLYRAVHNACLNAVSKNKKEVRMDEVPLKIVHQSAAPSADFQTRELEAEIAKALDQLPEQCRKVFELSRYGNLKYREIAEMQGISVKTVENQMGKALRILREQLAAYLPIAIPFIFCHLSHLIAVL